MDRGCFEINMETGRNVNKETSKQGNITSLSTRLFLWLFPLVFLIIFFFLPLSRILAFTFDTSAFDPDNLRIAGSALRFTFYQAFLSTLLSLLLGLPSAYLFARYDFRGKSILRAALAEGGHE